jgi:hypothetical protein
MQLKQNLPKSLTNTVKSAMHRTLQVQSAIITDFATALTKSLAWSFYRRMEQTGELESVNQSSKNLS